MVSLEGGLVGYERIIRDVVDIRLGGKGEGRGSCPHRCVVRHLRALGLKHPRFPHVRLAQRTDATGQQARVPAAQGSNAVFILRVTPHPRCRALVFRTDPIFIIKDK